MRREKWIHWTRRLLTAVALAVLCVNLITFLLDVTGLRESLGWLPYSLHTVESGSMEPVICRGDLILVKRVPYDTLTVGDDVTFITTEGFVTHRLVGVQGRRFITQGLANMMADPATMGQENYCGKVIRAVPGLGLPLKRLADAPAAVALLCLLILMLTLGQPLLRQWYEKRFGGEEAAVRGTGFYPRRALFCAALISVLLGMPTMTEAKYLTQLNRYELAVAQNMYFSSNYLSGGEGNIYSIQGWTGNDYVLNLDIKNSDNVLLYNREDMDLVYGIAVEVLPGSNENYTVELSSARVEEADIAFPFPISWQSYGSKKAYILEGGAANDHQFQVVIGPVNGYSPQPKDVVRVAIHACTSETETYFKSLKGTFHLQVAEANTFLGQVRVDDMGSMVGLSLTTNLINDGSSDGEKLVAFRWDPGKLYINEYERTAFNAIQSKNGYYSKTEGLLYIRLQAYSKIKLEFFKKTDFTASNGDFAIAVVDNIQQRPEFSAPQPALSQSTEGENQGNS